MRKRLMIVGLGYVGIQLAYAFSKCGEYEVVGFDINRRKIEQYQKGKDITREIGEQIGMVQIEWCCDLQDTAPCDIYIITVPTPTKDEKPDYTFVDSATQMVAKHMEKGALVIYESTYPPYTTETRCVPMLEAHSGLLATTDFTFAYSPERVNPGDKIHTLATATKLVAANDESTLCEAIGVYQTIVEQVKGVSSIPIAEAAKIVENSQRDLNIALLNQFSMLYPDIAMRDMVEAMNTKWNALGFYNGLVGGHCVAEDPCFLIEQQKRFGNQFSMLEEARKINEQYVSYMSDRIREQLEVDEDVLFFGLTFKPNTPDIRNSKALDIYLDLKRRGYRVYAVDPYQDEITFECSEESVVFATEEQIEQSATRVYAVGHQTFLKRDIETNPNIRKVIDVTSHFHPKVGDEMVKYISF